MGRVTKEITTPGGHQLIIKTYLTARETMGFLDSLDLPNSKKSEMLMEQAVVSLNGSTENISERLLDLPLAEYTAVLNEVNAIVTPTTPGNSAQPGGATS